mgnify:CR=1 FL=1
MEHTQSTESLLCPLRYALSLIGGKWKLPILCILADGKPKRYGEIKKRIPEITNMMLSQSLKELEIVIWSGASSTVRFRPGLNTR